MTDIKLADHMTKTTGAPPRSELLERAANTKRKYQVNKLSHVVFVCADMERTTRFYSEVLHFPLTLTSYQPGVGQHFFFEYAPGQNIAFFWFEQAPPRIVNVTAPNFGFYDENGDYVPRIAGVSAHGSMHHIAFEVSLEEMQRMRADLKAKGITVSDPEHEGGSVYLQDPDGVCLEFTCLDLSPPSDKSSVRHEPRTASDQVMYSPSQDPAQSSHYYYLKPTFRVQK